MHWEVCVMKKTGLLLASACVCLAFVIAGCGGGSSAPATPTTIVATTGGAATITAAQNASANIIVDDSAISEWKVRIPKGTLAADTTFTFAEITFGAGGVPAIPANLQAGDPVQITAIPAIPAGKIVTIMQEDEDVATLNTVDLYTVVLGAWVDFGYGIKNSDGTIRASVWGFSQLVFAVSDASGTYDETFTITSSSNTTYCGAVGPGEPDDNVVAQDGVEMTFNPDDPDCDTIGTMKANGAFTVAISCTETDEGCTVTRSGMGTGTLDILAIPKEYSATVSMTVTFSGTCGDAPASCTMAGTAVGVQQPL